MAPERSPRPRADNRHTARRQDLDAPLRTTTATRQVHPFHLPQGDQAPFPHPEVQHQSGLPGHAPRGANSRKYSTCRNSVYPNGGGTPMQQCHPACNVGLRGCVKYVAGRFAMPPFPSPGLSGHFSTRRTRAIFCAVIRECLSWTALYSNACRGHRRAAIPDGMRRPCPARHGRRTLQPAGCTGPAQDEDVRTDHCRTVPQGRKDTPPRAG